jgi:hypothetical protein
MTNFKLLPMARILAMVSLIICVIKNHYLDPYLTGLVLALAIPFTSASSGLLIGADLSHYFARVRSAMAWSSIALSLIALTFLYVFYGSGLVISLLPEILFICLITPYLVADIPMLSKVRISSPETGNVDYAEIVSLAPLALVLCLIPLGYIATNKIGQASAQHFIEPILNSMLITIGLSLFLPDKKEKSGGEKKEFSRQRVKALQDYCILHKKQAAMATYGLISTADIMTIQSGHPFTLSILGIISVSGIAYFLKHAKSLANRCGYALVQIAAILIYLLKNE